MSQRCRAVLVKCMDFRLDGPVHEWMNTTGLAGDCDVVSVAGAGKGMAGQGPEREFLLKQIETAVRLHHVSRVYLMHHADCGAYKAGRGFATAAEEKARQMEDMDEVEKLLVERFPGVEVHKIWACFKGAGGREVEFLPVPGS